MTQRQPLYTVDIGTDLPADLTHLVEWFSDPKVTKIRVYDKRRNQYFYKSGGYQFQVAPCHVFTSKEDAKPLLEQLRGIREAQGASRDAWLRSKEEQAVKVFTDIADQFPQIPGFKRWELVTKESYLDTDTVMILHLTPEEEEILDLESGYPFPIFEIIKMSGQPVHHVVVADDCDHFLKELKSMLAKITTGNTP